MRRQQLRPLSPSFCHSSLSSSGLHSLVTSSSSPLALPRFSVLDCCFFCFLLSLLAHQTVAAQTVEPHANTSASPTPSPPAHPSPFPSPPLSFSTSNFCCCASCHGSKLVSLLLCPSCLSRCICWHWESLLGCGGVLCGESQRDNARRGGPRMEGVGEVGVAD